MGRKRKKEIPLISLSFPLPRFFHLVQKQPRFRFIGWLAIQLLLMPDSIQQDLRYVRAHPAATYIQGSSIFGHWQKKREKKKTQKIQRSRWTQSLMYTESTPIRGRRIEQQQHKIKNQLQYLYCHIELYAKLLKRFICCKDVHIDQPISMPWIFLVPYQSLLVLLLLLY